MSTILGLDIGTEFVKAVLARQGKKGNLEILGVGKARQDEGNMHAGAIADIPAVVSVCEEALSAAEEQAYAEDPQMAAEDAAAYAAAEKAAADKEPFGM